jgi:hypothetical protein
MSMSMENGTVAGDALRAIAQAMSEKAMEVSAGTEARIAEIRKLAADNTEALNGALDDIAKNVREACEVLRDATTDHFGMVAQKLDDLAEFAHQAHTSLSEHHNNIRNGVAALTNSLPALTAPPLGEQLIPERTAGGMEQFGRR